MKYFTLLFLFSSFACNKQFSAKDLERVQNGGRAVVSITTTVRDSVELPECNASSEKLTAYIIPKDVFVKCNGGDWTRVRPGSTNSSFVSRSSIRFYEWEDRVSKKRWSIPLDNELSATEVSPNGCSNGWKLPTAEELIAASGNGLFEGIKAHGGRAFPDAWTNDFTTIDGVSQRLAVGLSNKGSASPKATKNAGLYCVSYASNS